jgi:hypothetical protein
MTTFTETANGALVFTLPTGHPKGDVPALGRLTVNELQGVNQQWAVWGIEADDAYDITAASAALYYECESRTPLGSATTATASSTSGFSGGTPNALQALSLPPFDVPIMSTQAAGGGAHLTHVGTFRVFLRVNPTAPTGTTTTLRLDWAVGDFTTYTSNPSTDLTLEAQAVGWLVDLGYVTIPKPTTGAQRWEGRVVARSSAGTGALLLDYLFLVPVDYGSGELASGTQTVASSAPTAYDTFDQAAGALTGKSSSGGAQVWTAQTIGGTTTDFQVDATNHVATRTVTTDGTSRAVSLGTTSYASMTWQVDVWLGDLSPIAGSPPIHNVQLFARYVDNLNYMRIEYQHQWNSGLGQGTLNMYRTIAGAQTNIRTAPVNALRVAQMTWYTFQLTVDASGRARFWGWPRGGTPGAPQLDVTDTAFATGGTLASGAVGIKVAVIGPAGGKGPIVQQFDNAAVFSGTTVITDALVFANRQLEVRHDTVQRQDATGTFWQPVGSNEGDLLRLPAAGREGRRVRGIVKLSRNLPGGGVDFIDDLSAVMQYQPRYLSVPTAA